MSLTCDMLHADNNNSGNGGTSNNNSKASFFPQQTKCLSDAHLKFHIESCLPDLHRAGA